MVIFSGFFPAIISMTLSSPSTRTCTRTTWSSPGKTQRHRSFTSVADSKDAWTPPRPLASPSHWTIRPHQSTSKTWTCPRTTKQTPFAKSKRLCGKLWRIWARNMDAVWRRFSSRGARRSPTPALLFDRNVHAEYTEWHGTLFFPFFFHFVRDDVLFLCQCFLMTVVCWFLGHYSIRISDFGLWQGFFLSIRRSVPGRSTSTADPLHSAYLKIYTDHLRSHFGGGGTWSFQASVPWSPIFEFFSTSRHGKITSMFLSLLHFSRLSSVKTKVRGKVPELERYLSWNSGKPHDAKRAWKRKSQAEFVPSDSPWKGPCFNSGTVSTQGLTPCTRTWCTYFY